MKKIKKDKKMINYEKEYNTEKVEKLLNIINIDNDEIKDLKLKLEISKYINDEYIKEVKELNEELDEKGDEIEELKNWKKEYFLYTDYLERINKEQEEKIEELRENIKNITTVNDNQLNLINQRYEETQYNIETLSVSYEYSPYDTIHNINDINKTKKGIAIKLVKELLKNNLIYFKTEINEIDKEHYRKFEIGTIKILKGEK